MISVYMVSVKDDIVWRRRCDGVIKSKTNSRDVVSQGLRYLLLRIAR